MRIFHSGRTQVDGISLAYVVTEYAEESLAEVIPERALTIDEARDMLDPVLEALAYIHGQGLVHARIKPSNIMVVDDRVKLPVESVRRAGTSAAPGAELRIYDAPEMGVAPISPPADLWSLGITLVEALTQLPPLWDRSTNRDPVVSGSIPQPFAEIARGCVRYVPEQRASLRDIRARLDNKVPVPEPVVRVEKPAPAAMAEPIRHDPEPSRRRIPIIAIGAGALIILVLLVWLVMRSHHAQTPSQPVTQSSVSSTIPQVQVPVPAQPSPTGQNAKGDVAQRVMPDVPPNAQRTIRGKIDVRVRVSVGRDGAVSDAKFDAQGHSRYFAGKAMEAARQWRFKPAQADGQSVPSVWVLRFQFKKSGTDASGQQVSP